MEKLLMYSSRHGILVHTLTLSRKTLVHVHNFYHVDVVSNICIFETYEWNLEWYDFGCIHGPIGELLKESAHMQSNFRIRDI